LSKSKIDNAVVILTKKQVRDSLLTDYLSRKQELEEKIKNLEQKYQVDLQTFETQLESSSVENFEAWDDLIQWKAYNQFLFEIETKINDIRNGDFQMAE
jgi:galactokinase